MCVSFYSAASVVCRLFVVSGSNYGADSVLDGLISGHNLDFVSSPFGLESPPVES